MRVSKLGLATLFTVISACSADTRAADNGSWQHLAQGAGQALNKQDEDAAFRYNMAALVELEKMASRHQHINAVKHNREFAHLHSLEMNLTYPYSKQIMDLRFKHTDEIRKGSNNDVQEINEAIARAKEGMQRQREAAYDPKLTGEQHLEAMSHLSQQFDKEIEEIRAAYKRAQDRSNQAKLPTLDQMVTAQKQIVDLDSRVAAAFTALLGSNHELTVLAVKDKKQAEDDYSSFSKEYQELGGTIK